jgi:hypothetical protein
MRSHAPPKVYRSFEEFERDELRKLDMLTMSVDDLLDQMFGNAASELLVEKGSAGGGVGGGGVQ